MYGIKMYPCIYLFTFDGYADTRAQGYMGSWVWNSIGDLKFQPNPITFRISLEEEMLNQLDDV
jgi:hypothetical protein